jgi:hypothetical protein
MMIKKCPDTSWKICAALALLASCLAVAGADGRRMRCYKCISTHNVTGNFRLKGDDCLDPFNTNARNRDAMVRCRLDGPRRRPDIVSTKDLHWVDF